MYTISGLFLYNIWVFVGRLVTVILVGVASFVWWKKTWMGFFCCAGVLFDLGFTFPIFVYLLKDIYVGFIAPLVLLVIFVVLGFERLKISKIKKYLSKGQQDRLKIEELEKGG